MKKLKKSSIKLLIVGLFLFIFVGDSFSMSDVTKLIDQYKDGNVKDVFKNDIDNVNNNLEIPDDNGEYYKVVNDNIPSFSLDDKEKEPFEEFSPLDSLNRPGVALAKLGVELMPTEDRGSIGQVKPAGWQTVKYDFVSGKYLYNRCHLIGFQLSGENANELNLITGTRSFNVEGMLPFENMVADYIKETNNTVMYRVTPVYEGNNLVASGVYMEAESIEDDDILFNVFVFNTEPGVTINYLDGTSFAS